MDRGAWWATAHGVMESQTQLSQGNKDSTQVEDVNFKLSTRLLEHRPVISPPTNQKQSHTACSPHPKSVVVLVAQLVNNPPAIQETLVLFLGQEDLQEKG